MRSAPMPEDLIRLHVGIRSCAIIVIATLA